MSIETDIKETESEIYIWFKKVIADIKAKLLAEHHAAVDEVAAQAVAPTPVVVQGEPAATVTDEPPATA